jgi:hypothetical protein
MYTMAPFQEHGNRIITITVIGVIMVWAANCKKITRNAYRLQWKNPVEVSD